MARTKPEIEAKVAQLNHAVFEALCQELQPGINTQCEGLRGEAQALLDEAKDALLESGNELVKAAEKIQATANDMQKGAQENWRPLAKAVASGVVTSLIGVAGDETNRGVAFVSDATTDKEAWTWLAGLVAALTGWVENPSGSLDDLRVAMRVLITDAPTSLTGELR